MTKSRITGIFTFLILFCLSGHSQENKFNIFGFYDFEIEYLKKGSEINNWSFDQHHLNIVTNYQINNQFTVFTEMVWEHVPAFSPDQISGQLYLGKAFLQYKQSDAFNVIGGKFLSPFGILNERHDAAPTFLYTHLPLMYRKHELIPGEYGRMFARHSVGVQLLGNFNAGPWMAKYQLYITNGQGPNFSGTDINSNKGLGYRFIMDNKMKGFTFGTSFYTDKNGLFYDIRQTAIGFDAEISFANFMFQSELVYSRVEELDHNMIPNGIFNDLSAYYILGSYSVTDKLTPFVRFDISVNNLIEEKMTEQLYIGGLNYAVKQSIFLKGEFQLYRFPLQTENKYNMFIASVAVAF